jgi:chromosome segregation ATPase
MKAIRGLSGVLLILAAIGGLFFSVFGIVSVNRYKPILTETLIENLDVINTTLEATADGLAATQSSLEAAVIAMGSLQNTVSTTAATIQSSEPMLDTLVQLMDEELPNTIRATQSSLQTAQESAKVIDSVLNAVSLLPGISYNPQTPLHEALGEVSDSMDNLPDSFGNLKDSLEDARHNLQIIQVDLALMADTIRQIEVSLAESESVLEQYQTTMDSIQSQISKLQENLPDFLDNAAIAVYVFLGWMAIAEIGLFTQGWELFMGESESNPKDETSE